MTIARRTWASVHALARATAAAVTVLNGLAEKSLYDSNTAC